LQIVDWCAKSIAIDKMNSFCRSAASNNASFAERLVFCDGQNESSFCSILCAADRSQGFTTAGTENGREEAREGAKKDGLGRTANVR
jgi:hypothetical protein